MPTVTIGTTGFPTYASAAQANAYLSADFTASAWRAETDADNKARAIVTATRVLDRLIWPGSMTESDQDNAWPRVNTNVPGVVDDEVPTAIVNASIELANIILTGTDVLNNDTTNPIHRQAAGSVSIEYFRALEDPSRLPLAVQELIAPYLGNVGQSLIQSFGTDKCSQAPHFNVARGF